MDLLTAPNNTPNIPFIGGGTVSVCSDVTHLHTSQDGCFTINMFCQDIVLALKDFSTPLSLGKSSNILIA